MSGRVLVVDDDPAMVATLCDILEIKGWAPERAYSGEEALLKARDRVPDVVVMDIKMGGMNGVETLRALRSLYPNLAVVLMTAYSASELVEEAKTSGAIDVLAKPVDPARLISMLESLQAASRRVLVVDDDPMFLTTLASAVEGAGYSVLQAASLTDALEQLASRAVATVLLDMVMPGSGPEAAIMAIRSASPSAVFILFSGHPEVLDETARRLPDRWVRACLYKPFDVDELLRILDGRSQE